MLFRFAYQHHDLSFMYDAGKVTGVSIVIKHHKNNLKQLPVTLFLPPNINNELCCPVKALQCYRTEYKHTSGPLFQLQNGSAVLYAFIAEKLSMLIKILGVDHNRYKPQYFRIGATTSAYCQKMILNAWADGNLILSVDISVYNRIHFLMLF